MNEMKLRASLSRRTLLKLSSLSSLGLPDLAHASVLPDQPIKVVVPYTAGGAIDMLGRLFAEVLKSDAGANAVVENRTGAGGLIAMRYVATSKADGTTVGLGGTGPLIFSKLTKKELPFDPDELEIVAPLGGFGYVLVTHPNSTVKTFRALLEKSKVESLNFGSAQVGSSTQMTLDYLKNETGLKGQAIPFNGDTDILNSVMGRSVDVGVVTIAGALALIETGRVTPLAITSSRRSPRLPNVPTVRELGFESYVAEVWSSLMVPKGTPTEIQARYNEIVNRQFTRPEVKERLLKIAVDFTPMSLAEVKAFRIREANKWKQVADKAGIVPQ